MTAKIIEFPNKPESKKIEEQMQVLQDSLGELYQTLEKIQGGYKELTQRANEMESTYQMLLEMYSEEVGAENIGIKWLEYCTFVDFKVDEETGKISMTFAPPNLDEEPDE